MRAIDNRPYEFYRRDTRPRVSKRIAAKGRTPRRGVPTEPKSQTKVQGSGFRLDMELAIKNQFEAQRSGFKLEEEAQRNERDLALPGRGEGYGACADDVTRLVCIFIPFGNRKSRTVIAKSSTYWSGSLIIFQRGAGDEARLHFSLQSKEKLRFGSVEPSPPTCPRQVGTYFSIPVGNRKKKSQLKRSCLYGL